MCSRGQAMRLGASRVGGREGRAIENRLGHPLEGRTSELGRAVVPYVLSSNCQDASLGKPKGFLVSSDFCFEMADRGRFKWP